jgi:hypothetical protein
MAGQEFNIIVRRVATRRMREILLSQEPRIAAEGRTPVAGQPVDEAPGGGTYGGGTYSRESHNAGTPVGEAHGDRTHGGGTYTTEADSTEMLPTAEHPAAEHKVERVVRNWRYVTGTFQVKVPVTTPQMMLRLEEDTLAIMKWRLQVMAQSSRWYPVLQRYISYLSERVEGLGGDPNAIPASPEGAPIKDGAVQDLVAYTGKVIEVIYDCFGEFEGFVLSDCGDMHTFKTRERAIGEIALRACRQRLLLSVYTEGGHRDGIRKLAIRC